ncbi:hypothetical protein [Carnobacterium maltaromaticum]|uniref:hypothetical protein n=1 Tax=Carnobacterium maltaromaticum TaxID=2751 RepID=UPI001C4DDAD8|nr:hypothetical protein [Carnobacterium maltaromaticum]
MIPIIEELEEYRTDGKHPFNEQVIYEFENGFGASVILGVHTYGLEMMLICDDDLLLDDQNDYVENQIKELDSDLWYDVVGHMDKEKMSELLHGIKAIKRERGARK